MCKYFTWIAIFCFRLLTTHLCSPSRVAEWIRLLYSWSKFNFRFGILNDEWISIMASHPARHVLKQTCILHFIFVIGVSKSQQKHQWLHFLFLLRLKCWACVTQFSFLLLCKSEWKYGAETKNKGCYFLFNFLRCLIRPIQGNIKKFPAGFKNMSVARNSVNEWNQSYSTIVDTKQDMEYKLRL